MRLWFNSCSRIAVADILYAFVNRADLGNETPEYFFDDDGASPELADITQRACDSSKTSSDIAEQKLLEVEMQVCNN